MIQCCFTFTETIRLISFCDGTALYAVECELRDLFPVAVAVAVVVFTLSDISLYSPRLRTRSFPLSVELGAHEKNVFGSCACGPNSQEACMLLKIYAPPPPPFFFFFFFFLVRDQEIIILPTRFLVSFPFSVYSMFFAMFILL